ncbi:hypothetical protein AWENTII_002059 [Aspergillus wentii]
MEADKAASKSVVHAVSEEPSTTNSPSISDQQSIPEQDDGKQPPPLVAKLFAVLLISCISFGSHWSSGVTGAMKSTIKKVPVEIIAIL